jgi:hypothetical protein
MRNTKCATSESNSKRYFILRKCVSCQERNKIRNNAINQDACLTKTTVTSIQVEEMKSVDIKWTHAHVTGARYRISHISKHSVLPKKKSLLLRDDTADWVMRSQMLTKKMAQSWKSTQFMTVLKYLRTFENVSYWCVIGTKFIDMFKL